MSPRGQEQSQTACSVDVRLKCFYTNANNVLGKMPDLRERTKSYDIVGIVETWANTCSHIGNAELALDGFNMLRLDRNRMKGGGLLLYINENSKSSLCTELMTGTSQESL